MKIPSYLTQKYPVVLIAGLGGLFTVVRFASAQTWAPSGAPALPWNCVACSADGTRLVAGAGFVSCGAYGCSYDVFPIYTSADSGASWTPGSLSSYWSSVASSADGTKLMAATGNPLARTSYLYVLGLIYTSPDSGTTWAATSAPSNNWTSVACSADGTKLVAAASFSYTDVGYTGGAIYTSADSGVTWMQTTAPSNDWTSVASSADGTKLIAVSDKFNGNGAIYTSADSGVTWMQTTAPSNDWTSAASSADGTKLIAVGDKYNGNGAIYTSRDSGASWTRASAPTNDWLSVASSADGTRLVADGWDYHGYYLIFVSTDAGATWTPNDSSSHIWTSIASSADGTKLMAAAQFEAIYTSPHSPYEGPWKLTSAPSNSWASVASSATGIKLVAAASLDNGDGLVYISTNSGASWTQTSAPINDWSSIAASADGTKLVAVSSYYGDGLVYISTNSGISWTQTSAPINDWSSIAASADGTKLVAASSYYGDGLVYISTNSGASWTQTSAPTKAWTSVAASADGEKLIAVASKYYESTGGIFTSTNSGATWTQSSAPLQYHDWTSVASSADGQKLVAVGDYPDYFNTEFFGAIYASTNSGTTWTEGTVWTQGATWAQPSFWVSVASSADGSKFVAVTALGSILSSTNSGATWEPAHIPAASWTSVASSANGGKLVVVGNDSPLQNYAGGPIYTLHNPPLAVARVFPRLQISTDETNIEVLSPNNTNALVFFDGSLSTAAENDPLQYFWYEDGRTNAFGTGVVATNLLPVGAHTIVLVVSDGDTTGTNRLTFEIIPPAQAVAELLLLVNESPTAQRNLRPLVATLEAAKAAFERASLGAGIHQLGAFQNKVRAQIAPLDPALADRLLVATQQILDVVDGSGSGVGSQVGSPAAPGRIGSLAHQANGHVWLHLNGSAGQVHLLEASTNLVDWEMIGVAVAREDGQSEFEDIHAARFPSRYYRILSP